MSDLALSNVYAGNESHPSTPRAVRVWLSAMKPEARVDHGLSAELVNNCKTAMIRVAVEGAGGVTLAYHTYN